MSNDPVRQQLLAKHMEDSRYVDLYNRTFSNLKKERAENARLQNTLKNQEDALRSCIESQEHFERDNRHLQAAANDVMAENVGLEADNERLTAAFDSLYFFAEQALSGVDFGNRRVLAFAPLVALQQAIEQHRGLAESLEQRP